MTRRLPAVGADEAPVDHRAWRALGTNVHLLVHGGDADGARDALEMFLAEFDVACSRFRSDSELVGVNAAGGRQVRVSPLLARAVATALDAARRTGGVVDPTVGRAMRVIGYEDDFSLVAAGAARPNPVLRLAPVPGWQAVSVDVRSRALRVPPGVELDLGSTGKALAADLGAEAALAFAPEGGVLVSLGGDMVVAGRPPDGGWRVLVSEDSETPADSGGEVVAIEHGALATSSTTVRRWRTSEGAEMHHIVDPRTGLPAAGPWRTVSVAAETCVDANAAATATIVLGEGGLDWLAATGLAARLVGVDGSIERLGGWPSPS